MPSGLSILIQFPFCFVGLELHSLLSSLGSFSEFLAQEARRGGAVVLSAARREAPLAQRAAGRWPLALGPWRRGQVEAQVTHEHVMVRLQPQELAVRWQLCHLLFLCRFSSEILGNFEVNFQ